MEIKLKSGQTPNDDLTLIRGNSEINVFETINELDSYTIDNIDISIENTVGTPSGTASLSDSTLSLEFTNMKGDVGNQGLQGIQGEDGDAAIYDSTQYTLPSMENTSGDSTTKVMTQRAITQLCNSQQDILIDIINGSKHAVRIFAENVTNLPYYILDDGGSFSQEIVVNSGYTIDSITITMGGTNITSSAWNSLTNTISINSVTDNVIVECSVVVETHVVGKFNVTSTAYPTAIMCNESGIDVTDLFSSIIIDGIEQQNVVNEYTFSTTGEHTVKYTLVDPTEIGENAFLACYTIKSITIPNSVTSIGSSAFNQCEGLTSIIIPNSVVTIGNEAFYGCTGLTSVTIGNSVATIGDSAFAGCESLETITIGDSQTQFGDISFGYGCFCNCPIVNIYPTEFADYLTNEGIDITEC